MHLKTQPMPGRSAGRGPRDTSFQLPGVRKMAMDLSERNFSKNTEVMDGKQWGSKLMRDWQRKIFQFYVAQRSSPVLLQANLQNIALFFKLQPSVTSSKVQETIVLMPRGFSKTSSLLKGVQHLQSLCLGSLLPSRAPARCTLALSPEQTGGHQTSFPFHLPSHQTTPQLTESFHSGTKPNTATISIILSACLRKTAYLQWLATMLCTTPFRVYFTLNLQARDPPVGLHKAELLVQMFLKIDATPDPKKLKGY